MPTHRPKLSSLSLALASVSTSVFISALATPLYAAEQLPQVTVSADLRETAQQDMPASVSVYTQTDLQDQGATHFDDVLLKTPNVNYSGQSSRARHIQIRGMGERDEYTGAPNSSVGFAIDDIDFSGIGMTGNLFDVKQVEVLRGPQNTRYGQSAIGGLVNIQTNDPTAHEEGMAELTLGQDNLKEFGLVTSGPFSAKEGAPQYRISVFKHGSDGFRTNDTLDKTDTNGRDELNVRAKFRLTPNPNTLVDVSLIHADLNNGYDAFARDNSFTTLSNEPGKDTQLSNAGSVKVVSTANPDYVLTSKTSLANSDMVYSYDDDWTADSIGAYRNDKMRRTVSQEIRLTSTESSRLFKQSTDWLMGVYGSNLEETNDTEYYATSSSEFSLQKVAGFGQLDYAMTPKATLTGGLRIEQNTSQFSNSNNENYTPEETLWGANVSYSYKYNATHTAFTGITRGYKAGGFNPGQPSGTSNEYLRFDAETLLNYELGLKSDFASLGLKTNITAFYMDRSNPQLDGYTYDPSSFTNYVFYTENFDSANSYGLEGDFSWRAHRSLTVFGSLGLMQTQVNGTPLNSGFTISGREAAHAPSYQLNVGAKYRHALGYFAQADVTGVDSFYFDNTHNIQSDAYRLINARLGYETKDYEVYVWGKNLTDETYATRGFYFDFNAPYTNPSEYNRLGDPRQVGVTARVYF
ncbi:TonB-dependent receptor [Thiomicrorhabdus aquaedulcis]|uniref:TonB-dependent receptor n=1 Tax=Thiomicrorhabdus aquaedulcis TaxID=2211106 RepID=UPI000FDC84AA|nr:TonB-dependent receptor [Thiomicrorhabdus aquaedulcis]